jgi:hypothetical protein
VQRKHQPAPPKVISLSALRVISLPPLVHVTPFQHACILLLLFFKNEAFDSLLVAPWKTTNYAMSPTSKVKHATHVRALCGLWF